MVTLTDLARKIKRSLHVCHLRRRLKPALLALRKEISERRSLAIDVELKHYVPHRIKKPFTISSLKSSRWSTMSVLRKSNLRRRGKIKGFTVEEIEQEFGDDDQTINCISLKENYRTDDGGSTRRLNDGLMALFL